MKTWMLIFKMNMLMLVTWACLSAVPAFAQNPCATVTCRSAPAPLIGFGLPAALAVGGVLLGGKLLKRTRRR